MNEVLPVMAEKLYSICDILDYKTCYDTLSRSILFRKLERYGVRELALTWSNQIFRIENSA